MLTHCGALFSFGGGYRCGSSSTEAVAVLGISAGASAAATDEKLGKQGGVSPTRVCDDALDSARVKQIECGWDHCMVVTDDGALFTWGSGRSGQLGHGDTGEIPQFWVSCRRSEGWWKSGPNFVPWTSATTGEGTDNSPDRGCQIAEENP